jgi:hypothetical protein
MLSEYLQNFFNQPSIDDPSKNIFNWYWDTYVTQNILVKLN